MPTRRAAWREIAFGLIAGAWLSLARLPDGVDWTQIPAADARWNLLARQGALLAIGVVLFFTAARVRTAQLLCGAALGFALHGFFAANWLVLAGAGAFVLATLIVVLALVGLSKTQDDGEPAPAGRLELTGLVIVGAGVGLALQRVASTLRMTSLGRPADDTAMAVSFLVLLAFGASAFGPLLSRTRVARFALPIAAVVAVAACMDSNGVLQLFSEREGLEKFLLRPPWRLDVSRVGLLDGDLLIAARVLVLPAFALGLALACALDRRRLGSVLIGATCLGPSAKALLTDVEFEFGTARAIAVGIAIAAAGAALCIARIVESSRLARGLAITTCACLALVVGIAPLRAAMPMTPWESVPPVARWKQGTAHGLATVERVRGAALVATLDRRRLTPLDSELAADAQRLRFAGPGSNVLLVGQLTPARLETFRSMDVARVDRTAVWSSVMEAMERELFDGAPVLIPGAVISPDEARKRAESGAYDLIVVPPIEGAAPVTDPPQLPASTRFVAWLDASAPIAARDWGERVLLASDGGEQLSIGVLNAHAKESRGAANARSGLYPAGRRVFVSAALAELLEPSWQREFVHEARTSERLAHASRGTASERLTAGLALHFAVQMASSPYESRAQQIEIDAAALERLRDAALEREPDLFVRELWNGLGRTLLEKRDVENVERTIAPLAERWKFWLELETALAVTDLELLDPESAITRLAAATAVRPGDVELLALLARALVLAGRPADAAKEFESALAVAPERRDLQRELAMARTRGGDPAARAAIEALLRVAPDDSELARYLEPGPWPPPPPAVLSRSRHEH